MSSLAKLQNRNQRSSRFSNLGLKENIFLMMVFGWSGLSLVLSTLIGSSNYKNLSSTFISISLFASGLSLSYIAVNPDSILTRLFICISIVIFVISFDCYYNKFTHNLFIHLVNSGYIGVGVYFWLIKLYPESFPDLWQTIMPSAPQAFNMLIFCLVFQNVGYYMLWGLLFPLLKPVLNWLNSYKNLANLTFLNKKYEYLILFIILATFGLISRLWNFSIGNIYYTEGSGIPSYISSFLAQFDQLYVIAWLYGYALSVQEGLKKNTVTYLTWMLIHIEFLYQLISGSKGRFFKFIILPMATVFIVVRQRISWGAIFILGGIGAFSWLFVYPVLVNYRELMSGITIYDAINTKELLNQSVQRVLLYSREEYIETILIPFTRSGIAEQVTAMTSIVHFQVSQEGNTLWLRLFLFWVPRFLWSDKPEALSGNLIGRLSHRLNPGDYTTSVLSTGPGELFLYYELWGSSLMVLAGLVFRGLNESISPFKFYTPFRVAVFVAFLSQMKGILSGSFESGLTGIFLQIGVLYLILLVAKILIKPRGY